MPKFMSTFADQVSPVIEELGEAFIEYNSRIEGAPRYQESALFFSAYIFSSILIDRMWVLQEKEVIDMETRKAMAVDFGTKLRELIKIYTNIDMHEETLKILNHEK